MSEAKPNKVRDVFLDVSASVINYLTNPDKKEGMMHLREAFKRDAEAALHMINEVRYMSLGAGYNPNKGL